MVQSLIALALADEGIDDSQMERLRECMEHAGPDHRERVLLPFLNIGGRIAGNVVAAPRNRDLLRCLATTAPVCAYMRPAVFELIDRLVQVAPNTSTCCVANALVARADLSAVSYCRVGDSRGVRCCVCKAPVRFCIPS